MTDWTNEQINVFDASGNVLVYASAGSGKTSVMVKKIVDDVVKGVPVKDILVVSYTKASATDMRLKSSTRCLTSQRTKTSKTSTKSAKKSTTFRLPKSARWTLF